MFGAKKREPSDPMLKQLHWLPTKERIEDKLALWVYKCLMNTSLKHLSDLLIIPSFSKYHLRSQNIKHDLKNPTHKHQGSRTVILIGMNGYIKLLTKLDLVEVNMAVLFTT